LSGPVPTEFATEACLWFANFMQRVAAAAKPVTPSAS
jgi:hypothetical protein